MRRINMTICATLLGVGILLAGCGAGAATDTPRPTPTSATLPATAALATDTVPAAPPTAVAATDTALPPPATDTSAPAVTAQPSPTTVRVLPPPPATVTAQPPLPTSTRAPAPARTPTAGAEAGLVITNTNAGQTITLKVGQTLLVELRDRVWSTPVVDHSILAVAPLNIMVPVGATAWKYKAIAPGQTTLTTEGSCPPNPNGPRCMSILLYKVTVVVTR